MINTLHTSSYKNLCGNRGTGEYSTLGPIQVAKILDNGYARRFVLVERLPGKQPGVQKFLPYFQKYKSLTSLIVRRY